MSTLQSANSKASDTLAAATETGVPSAAPSARAAAAGPPEIVKNAQHSSLSASTSGAGANASGARRIALCGLIASPVCRQSRDRTIQGAARRTAQALYWVRQVAVESNDVVGCPGSPSAMQVHHSGLCGPELVADDKGGIIMSLKLPGCRRLAVGLALACGWLRFPQPQWSRRQPRARRPQWRIAAPPAPMSGLLWRVTAPRARSSMSWNSATWGAGPAPCVATRVCGP